MTMMNDHQRRSFEEFTAGMPPEQKEQVRVELEARLKARAEQRVHEVEAMKAAQLAQLTQHLINTEPRRQYAAIVAVDERGGFSKNGEIPWHYPEDLRWFQQTTANSICVMGRTTYDDINKRIGDKGAESVLPGRRCFVVTSRALDHNNATAIANIGELDLLIADEDVSKTVFFIGGERIYREGIAKANTVYITVVNKDVEADLFFPVNYVLKHFTMSQMFKVDSVPDLRFTVWKRN